MTDNNDNFDSTDDADKRLLVELLYGERSLQSEDVSSGSSASGSSPGIKSDALEGELETMRGLRALFAELPDEEPPSALTAQLMHAAAMHAKKAPAAVPAESSGLFAKLRDWFMPVLSHPGLAAAATLVVVVGVAGSLYMRGEAKLAEPQVASEAAAPASAADRPEMPAGGVAQDPAAVAEGAGLDTILLGNREPAPEEEDFLGEGRQSPDDTFEKKSLDTVSRDGFGIGSGRGAASGGLLDDSVAIGSGAVKEERTRGADSKADTSSTDRWAQPPASTAPGSKTGGATKGKATSTIAVDLADEAVPLEVSADDDGESYGYGEADKTAEKIPAPKKSPAPKKPAAEPAPAPASPPPSPVTKAPAQDAPAAGASKDSEVRALHGRAVDAATRGDCAAVLRYANDIRKLDGAYYDKAFRSDKRLTTCLNSQSAPVKK